MLLGASNAVCLGASAYHPEGEDSLALRENLTLASEGLKRMTIYKDYKGSVEHLRGAIAADSTYAPAYYLLGSAYFKQGSIDSASMYARRAYSMDSLNKWYLELYAMTQTQTSNFSEAASLYRELMRREPQNAEYYRILAILYQYTNLPYSAIAVLDSAELRVGQNPYLMDMKRKLLLSTNQHDKALEQAKAAAEADPYLIDNRVVLAQMYGAVKQDSLAREEYSAAMQLDSTDLPLLLSLSDFYRERGDDANYLATTNSLFKSDELPLDQKISQFNQITANRDYYSRNLLRISMLASTLWLNHGDNKEVTYLYCSHLIATGSLDKALEIYKRKAAEADSSPDYYSSVIEIENYKGNTDSVALYIDRAIERFPQETNFKLLRSHTISYSGDHKAAIKSYKQTLELMESDTVRSEIWGYIGDSYHQLSLQSRTRLGEWREMRKAYSAYDKALELNADNVLVLNNYAYFLAERDSKLEHALVMSSHAVELQGDNSTYIDTYAWVLYKLGRYDQAKSQMVRAIALDKNASAELLFHYAEILTALDEKFMAEIYYKKALGRGYDEDTIVERILKLKE